jgi:hypothetical protein
MTPHDSKPKPQVVPELHVQTADGRVFRFTQSFHIGRDHDCALRLNEVHVSRKHVAVSFENGAWQLRDLKSANGMFVKNRRVETAAVAGTLSVTLGANGPTLTFEVESQGQATKRRAFLPQTVEQAAEDSQVLARYEERYLRAAAGEGRVGGRTMMIRRAFEKVQRKQRRRHWMVVGVLAVVGLAAVGYAYYKHRQIGQQQALAQDIFYAMKALDVNIANIELMIAQSGNAQAREQAKQFQARRRDLENSYDRYLAVLNLYDQKLSEEDRLILRITRLFGECELAAPPSYIAEVKNYIAKWKSSGRFPRAVKLAQDMGYTRPIVQELMGQSLPPQYFYLALQESDFDPFISGPPTRWGIAKGMWQFIPETGARYGLTIGPLAKMARADPMDDRNKWQKATVAAARYIKDIYATDAQASGLLVIASYNWGEHRIIDLLKTMPENPQERNFWKVLEKHRIPDQTYKYVFSIVSAAVIGENPRLFGFPFDNPLEEIVKQQASYSGR